jgi:hypothetical protein
LSSFFISFSPSRRSSNISPALSLVQVIHLRLIGVACEACVAVTAGLAAAETGRAGSLVDVFALGAGSQNESICDFVYHIGLVHPREGHELEGALVRKTGFVHEWPEDQIDGGTLGD